ncbi:Mu transposase domain-containing protein, partial [Ensifer sp. LCM 4579]|uniref:Mu transposase domain-containing protein n=1 Tax=Ensifer sp. LCM 4579 TaxID=1848292 RepID=UPI00387E4002
RARQSEVRRQPGELLQSRDQPQLRHNGVPLWRRRSAGTAAASEGQGQVENGVRFAQSCILGRLRKQTFFSLAEANTAIAEVLERINNHVMRRLGVSRRHLFETVERAALAALPAEGYEFAEWRFAGCRRLRQQVDIRATARMIEIFHRGKRVAVHQRRYGTEPVHMPSSHRRYAEWTPDRFRRWARPSVRRPRG